MIEPHELDATLRVSGRAEARDDVSALPAARLLDEAPDDLEGREGVGTWRNDPNSPVDTTVTPSE